MTFDDILKQGRGVPRQALVGKISLLLCSARQALVLVGVGTGQAGTIPSSTSRYSIRTERNGAEEVRV